MDKTDAEEAKNTISASHSQTIFAEGQDYFVDYKKVIHCHWTNFLFIDISLEHKSTKNCCLEYSVRYIFR